MINLDAQAPPIASDATSHLFIHKDSAFLEAPVIKHEQIDCLYIHEGTASNTPNYEYQAPRFHAQMKSLIRRYKALHLRLKPFANNDPLSDFEAAFLFECFFSKFQHYKDTDNCEYFSSIKRLLEENYLYLFALKESNPALADKSMTDIINSLKVCAPGVLTHLQDINSHLKSEDNLRSWLAQLRQSIVGISADKHTIKHQIRPAFHTHVHQAFVNLTNRYGFQLPKTALKDPFEVDANISKNDFLLFLNEFQQAYQAKDVMECVELNIKMMLNDFKRKYEADADGWVMINNNFALLSKEGMRILSALELSAENNPDLYQLFMFNEESTQLKINPAFEQNIKTFIEHKLISQHILTKEKEKAYNLDQQKNIVFQSSEFFNGLHNPLRRSRRQMRDGFLIIFFVAFLFNAGALMLASSYLFTKFSLINLDLLFHGVFAISTFGAGIFTKGCQALNEKLLNACTQSYTQLADEAFERLSRPQRLAFIDGLEAQVSYKAQATTFVTWRDYRHMTAYYAGMHAKITNNVDLIEKMTPRVAPV